LGTSPLPPSFAQKKQQAKDAAEADYKKIYDDAKINKEDILDEVKKLVELIKKAYAGTDKATTKTELEKYKNAKDTGDDAEKLKKKA
jgi:hypothetical protein